MQDRPICFHCDKSVDLNSEMVFEAPCGHDRCSSAVFHAICLFGWRERRQSIEKFMQEIKERWIRDHQDKED